MLQEKLLLTLNNRLTVCLLTLLLLPATASRANENDSEVANYAYASYLGSGIYNSSGGQLTVFNMPITYEPENQLGEYTYRLRLPVSVGFYDLDFTSDNSEDYIPSSVDTLTFVAGVEVDIPISEDLTLVPYVDLGWARNFTTRGDSLVYSTGLSSIYNFNAQARNHLWINRLVWAGYRTQSANNSDSFASIQSGVDWRTPIRFGSEDRGNFTTLYAIGYWYFKGVDFKLDKQRDRTVDSSYEVGFTFGFDKPVDLYLFELERVGLGYRHNGEFDLWRLTFNLPI